MDRERLRAIVSASLAVDLDEVRPDSDLVQNLRADSMDLVELLLMIENEMGIRIPGKDFAEIKTFEDLAVTVESQWPTPN